MQDIRQVDLSASAEARLLEYAQRCGGSVVFDQEVLERQMVAVVALLSEIDVALLPPIICDRVPRGDAA